MTITIFSFLSALIWSSLFVLITYLTRKVNGMKKYYGAPLLIFLYFFSIFRLLFPLEFTFTKVISSEKYYAQLYKVMYLNKFGNISILAILFIICTIVALYKIIKFIFLYNKTIRQMLISAISPTTREKNILNDIALTCNKNLNIELFKNNYLDTPIGIGLFKKIILLPNIEYTDVELNYILLHEYTHFLNKDIFVKIMTSIFCDVFWWNFIIQLLKKDLEQLLEIKCDLKVIKNMNKIKRAEYLSIILKTLKDSNKIQNVQNVGTALVNNNDTYIKERFDTIINYNDTDKFKVAKSIALVSTLAITILSYSFVLQPAYEAPEGQGSIRKENSYILKTSDGKYFLYIDNIMKGELSEEKVTILDEIGISIKEEEN